MEIEQKATPIKIQPQTVSTLDEMTGAGLHFGHKTSKTHPKMKPYITGVKNAIHVINLEKTNEKLNEALGVLERLVGEGKVVLFVGTKVQIKNVVKETAQACGVPYVSERWIGGLFTNMETILKRIEYFKDLEAKKESGELEKYTKKERLQFEKELRNLELKFGGLKALGRLPEAIFVFDVDKNELAVKEAKKRGVTVFAIVDTDIDPTPIDYPIPANDDSISSVKYILEKVKEVMLQAKVRTIPVLETNTNDPN